jgi:hypothetical protein
MRESFHDNLSLAKRTAQAPALVGTKTWWQIRLKTRPLLSFAVNHSREKAVCLPMVHSEKHNCWRLRLGKSYVVRTAFAIGNLRQKSHLCDEASQSPHDFHAC